MPQANAARIATAILDILEMCSDINVCTHEDFTEALFFARRMMQDSSEEDRDALTQITDALCRRRLQAYGE